MNILYSAPEINLSGGHGGSSHVSDVLASLKNLGHNITLIDSRKEATAQISKLHSYLVAPFLRTLWHCMFGNADIIYERNRIFGGGAILAGSLFGKPSILELNEPAELSFEGLRGAMAQWVFNRVSNKATIITGTHDSFFNLLPKEKCLLITYGTNADKFVPSAPDAELVEKFGLVRGKTILYCGSFAPWHMLENTIIAAKDIVANDSEVKFLLLGTGGQFEQIKKLVKSFALENNVLLLGKVPHTEMFKYINSADICLALFDRNYAPFKKYDYFYSPIKVHEYKSCAKPIIASRIGNLKTLVVDGVNGLLVDEQKPSDIAAVLLKLLSNKQLFKNIAENNRKDVLQNYDWDIINAKILKAVSARRSKAHSF